VYAYDSFVSEWGPGPVLSELFTEKTGITVDMISAGDAGQVLSRAILEKGDPGADLVIGIDNNLYPIAVSEDILSPYRSPLLDKVPGSLHFGEKGLLTPYDYGFFSIIYDNQKVKEPPVSLEDLTDPRFEDELVLMDPRTSTPGFGFLLWTAAVYGDEYLEYWKRLNASILTITEGWDAGYGLFTSGEAGLVLSYTSSPAYHVEYEDSRRYRAALFPEGHYMQIEGIGILAGAENRDEAEAFIDFMLSAEAQQEIPLTNWMFPVRQDVSLPDSFEYAVRPEKQLLLDYERVKEIEEEINTEWIGIVGGE
jgi:thiamine transport system substrate-binding protein